MANYANIVNIVSHGRHAGFGIPQISCIVNPWSLGCAFVSSQISLNYFLHKMPEKRPHAIAISF